MSKPSKPPRRRSWLTQAVLDTFEAAKDAVVADQELATSRLAVCESCTLYDGATCDVCRCHMRLKVKIKGIRCPIGKW